MLHPPNMLPLPLKKKLKRKYKKKTNKQTKKKRKKKCEVVREMNDGHEQPLF